MKKLTLKKISTAVLAATCVLGVGVAQALPKISISVTAPANTAGADKATTTIYPNYKTLPWVPCTNQATTLGISTNTTKLFNDLLQFDLSVTNADDNKDTNKLVDYDLYVFFVNYAATGAAANTTAGAKFYALTKVTSGFGGGTPTLTAYADSGTGANDLRLSTKLPSDFRYLANTDFTAAALKETIFGGPILLDQANLPQGLWSILTVLVDPAVVVPSTAAHTDKLQNPQNWAAWAVQPFILGTPFGTTLGTGTNNDGLCH